MQTFTTRPKNTRKLRVVRLAYMLATDQPVRPDDLCQQFGVSKRTFARYIADVREAGFGVTYSETEDSYRLTDAGMATSDTTGS